MKLGHQRISQYARMWPREVFDCLMTEGDTNRKRPVAKAKGLEILKEPGVYVLYRDDIPYYIGQAARLRSRLRRHATAPDSRYYNFWNFFSVFVIEDPQSRSEIEGLLIAAMPTANSMKPRLPREKFPDSVKKMVRKIRRYHADPALFKPKT